MKKSYVLLLLLSILLFNGCSASKITLSKIDNKELSNNALIIGSFSRELGSSHIGHNSFNIVDLNHKQVKNVFDKAKDNMSIYGKAYDYNTDYIYEKIQGSIFAVLIPEGSYYLHKFSAGRGRGEYLGKFYKKIDVKKGDILYIGDINFKPKLVTHPLYKNIKNINGAKVTIKHNLNRDYNIFKKYLGNNFYKKDKIKTSASNETFDLNRFESDFNMLMFLPVIVY